jgi:hypothetical protein
VVLTDTAKKEVVEELQEIYKNNQVELAHRLEVIVKSIKPSGVIALCVDNLNGSATDPRALGMLISKFP